MLTAPSFRIYFRSNIALDFQGREKLGLQCKRLLDIGRVRYLKEHGYDAELVYYVDKETSLENLALMAVPASKTASLSSQNKK
jgi:tRNA:m4X modification enzyme